MAEDDDHYFMTTTEREEIFGPASVALFGFRTDHQAEICLDKLLGVPMYDAWANRGSNSDRPMSDKYKTLLKGLAGPHSKAILRAYQIKHNIPYKEKVDG